MKCPACKHTDNRNQNPFLIVLDAGHAISLLRKPDAKGHILLEDNGQAEVFACQICGIVFARSSLIQNKE